LFSRWLRQYRESPVGSRREPAKENCRAHNAWGQTTLMRLTAHRLFGVVQLGTPVWLCGMID
jgi:hypothetical protein